MKIIAKIFLLIFIVIIIAPILILGYLGFIPGVSSLFGSNKPRDLGIKYTEEDRASGRAKSKIVYESLPADTPETESIQRTGSREVKAEFSSQEMTALMNNRPWKYWPYSNVQVKFNADGSGEISGVLLKDKVPGYGAYIGAPKQAIEFAMKFLPANPVFYVKGRAALTDNQVSLFEPQAFEIGRAPLPVSMFLSFVPSLSPRQVLAVDLGGMASELSKVKNKRALIIGYINSRLSTIHGFYAKTSKFTENKLIYEGTLPEKEITAR